MGGWVRGGNAAENSNLDKEVSFHPAEEWRARLSSPTAQSRELGAAEGRVGPDPSVSKARVGRVGDRAGNAAGEDVSHRGVFHRGNHRTRSALDWQNPPPPGCGMGCGCKRGRRWAAISGHLDTGDFKDLSRIDSRLRCLLPAPFPDSLCHLRLGLTFSHFLCVAGLSKLVSLHYLSAGISQD